MNSASRLRLYLIIGLAAATLFASALALASLNLGGDLPGPNGLSILPIATGYDRRAEPLLRADARLTTGALAEAAALSRSAINQYPYDISAWLRLAYVDRAQHGMLTSAGQSVLKRSYDLVAIDSFVGLWRVRFALENSQALSPELRADVRDEVSGLWLNGENRPALRQMAVAIRNPAGRLSLALWLNRLEAPVAK